MKFDWDPKKATSNKNKHGITFEEAITAFDDPYALIEEDARHTSEHRDRIIGEADPGVLVVVFTVRQSGSVYRIISARRASRKERKLYEEAKRIPI